MPHRLYQIIERCHGIYYIYGRAEYDDFSGISRVGPILRDAWAPGIIHRRHSCDDKSHSPPTWEINHRAARTIYARIAAARYALKIAVKSAKSRWPLRRGRRCHKARWPCAVISRQQPPITLSSMSCFALSIYHKSRK